MRQTLVDAIRRGEGSCTARTYNGAVTNSTSGDACLDLFSLAGASRGKDLRGLFEQATNQNLDVALRILLWARDVRGGAGERQLFRDLLLVGARKGILTKELVDKIPEVGRWDDVLVLLGTRYEDQALSMIASAINAQNALCAKWLPRKGMVAAYLRTKFGLTPKNYRKLLVALSNTVEQKMCANRWYDIDFGKIPSLASARYQKAFDRHVPSKYEAYKDRLTKGTDKVNAGAVYPYDVIKSLRRGDVTVSNAQWAALPDYCKDSDENIIAVVDTSGSMGVQVSGETSAKDVAYSLGMYLAERLPGAFKDTFITFSERPTLQTLKGSLIQRYNQMDRADWDMNTNLEAVFKLILETAVRNRISESEMPDKILVISDMEFDRCAVRGRTLLESAKARYCTAGYRMPKIVFWNVNGRPGNSPARAHDENVALVSGFSPSIMKSVLSGKDFSPRGIMLETVMIDRYDVGFPAGLRTFRDSLRHDTSKKRARKEDYSRYIRKVSVKR